MDIKIFIIMATLPVPICYIWETQVFEASGIGQQQVEPQDTLQNSHSLIHIRPPPAGFI